MNTINWRNAGPEPQILWEHLVASFDISAIVPLSYQGAITGSEFLTYNATKLYLALQLDFGSQLFGNEAYVQLFDDGNNEFLSYCNCIGYYDGMGAVEFINSLKNIYNTWFSRLAVSAANSYVYMKFIGYRLTYS